jgi:ribose transport system permease protein
VQSAPLLILAAGQTFALLMGGLDLSQGSIVSLVSVVTAGVMLHHTLALGAAAGLGVGFGISLVNGLLIGRARIQPFIVTLGTLYIAAGLAMVYSGGSSIFGLPKPDVDYFFWFGGGFIGPFPVPVLIAALLIVAIYVVLGRTRFGRHVYAVGGNESVAVMSGIEVGRVKIVIYLISGGCASIAGFLMSGRVISGQPLLGAGDILLQSIGAVIIGGTSVFGGPRRRAAYGAGRLYHHLYGQWAQPSRHRHFRPAGHHWRHHHPVGVGQLAASAARLKGKTVSAGRG